MRQSIFRLIRVVTRYQDELESLARDANAIPRPNIEGQPRLVGGHRSGAASNGRLPNDVEQTWQSANILQNQASIVWPVTVFAKRKSRDGDRADVLRKLRAAHSLLRLPFDLCARHEPRFAHLPVTVAVKFPAP